MAIYDLPLETEKEIFIVYDQIIALPYQLGQSKDYGRPSNIL